MFPRFSRVELPANSKSKEVLNDTNIEYRSNRVANRIDRIDYENHRSNQTEQTLFRNSFKLDPNISRSMRSAPFLELQPMAMAKRFEAATVNISIEPNRPTTPTARKIEPIEPSTSLKSQLRFAAVAQPPRDRSGAT